jgi:hypothetical protein
MLKTAVWATAAVLGVLQPVMAQQVKRADFGGAQPSRDARVIADWVVDSTDNRGLPFAIIDKRRAHLYVFAPGGRLRGHAPILLGLARGDHTVPGIGDREFSNIAPHERTTPAGRFVAERGRNLRGENVLWVDYDAAVSMHPVLTTNPAERRLRRLATPTPTDNRISYGCINVPKRFFSHVVLGNLKGPKTVVYVLPDVKPLHEVFRSYNVAERGRRVAQAAPQR